jgi:hypothetical protein
MSTPLTNRKINLLQATSINMIDMVGIGPFVVMPLLLANLIMVCFYGHGYLELSLLLLMHDME